jgi:hypothetical protein
MSTFNATDLKSFTLDISDRAIYNDIRSEVDITEDTEVTGDGTPEEHAENEVGRDGNIKVVLAANSSENVVFTAELGHTDVTWLEAYIAFASRTKEYGWPSDLCVNLGGTWYAPGDTYPSCCYFPEIPETIGVQSMIRTKTTWTVRITNPHNYEVRATPRAIYSYLVQEAIAGAVTIHTETRTLRVRATNAASIRKYGRRVMDLVWPLGITEVTMQSIVDRYCERYCEPVSMASMTLEGSTDARITSILDMEIDDKHRIIHPGLSMDQEFFVNSVNVMFNREGTGLLTGSFSLEEVRAMEEATIFKWDISEWDDGSVWG